MTWRKLTVLIAQLPPESATATALRLDERDAPGERESGPPHDPETEQWSRVEQLLAGIHDELNVLHWLYASAHKDPKKPLAWKPERLPRPGVAVEVKQVAMQPEQIRVLAAHLARTQGNDTAYN